MQPTSVKKWRGGNLKNNNSRISILKMTQFWPQEISFNSSFILWKARRYLKRKGKACMTELRERKIEDWNY